MIRRKTNRRHMTGDHHGRAAGRATLLVTPTDEILGTHSQGIAQHVPDGEPDSPRATVTGAGIQQIRRKLSWAA